MGNGVVPASFVCAVPLQSRLVLHRLIAIKMSILAPDYARDVHNTIYSRYDKENCYLSGLSQKAPCLGMTLYISLIGRKTFE